MFDRCMQHDGYHNTYSFTKDGYKVVFKSIRLEEFSKKPKPEREEVMTRRGAVDLSFLPKPSRSTWRRMMSLSCCS